MKIARVVTAGMCIVLIGAACAPGEPAAPVARPSPTVKAGPGKAAKKEPAAPPKVRILHQTFGETRRLVKQAIADIKTVRLWDDLTDHLYVIQIQSRDRVEDIPDDRHLADAMLQGYIDKRGSGGLCSIMFFPKAIQTDLERWESYWDQSLIAKEPPTLRQYWASILGHELGHCFDGQPGEKVAERWETRVLAAVRDRALE